MRAISFTLPLFLGALIVLQAGINRTEAGRIGFSSAILMNASVMLVVALGYFFASKSNLPANEIRWWFLLPGIFGFLIVLGGAFSVSRWGAQHTFILIVSAQLVMSIVWDYYVQKIPPTGAKLFGILLIWAGIFIALRPHAE